MRCWFFLLLFLFSLLPGSHAQEVSSGITLQVKQVSLSVVLREIETKSGALFSYNPDAIRGEQPVTFRCRNCSLSALLDKLLTPLGLSWQRVGEQIVIKQGIPPPASPVTSPLPPKKVTISGYVRDSLSGEALVGAGIRLREGSAGTTTNAYGYYALPVTGGEQTVIFSFLGFREKALPLNLQRDTLLSVDLPESSIGMREVVISARDEKRLPAVNQPGDFSFTGATLEKMPGFAGEPDVLKALQVLPGIRSFGDGSAFYYVRGGNRDQNLLMIDEAPIYNPSHLFGFFSVLSPDAVNDMEVYKGDFPAKYGGRTSSVITIAARDGNNKRFGFSGNLGPYASTLTLEGPVVKEKASFLVSGRLSTLNWLNYLMDETGSFSLWFYDINARINAQVSPRDRLFLTVYTGKDEFRRYTASVYRTYGISWNNLAGVFRWTHLFHPKLFGNLTVSYSRYAYFLYLSSNRTDYWTSSIANITAKTDFTWFLNARNTVTTGLAVTRYHSQPGDVIQEREEQLENRNTPPYTSVEYVWYAGNRQKLGKRFTLEYGIRLPLWQDLGPTTVYYFDANHQVIDTLEVRKNRYYDLFFSPEPRLSVGFALSDHASLKASYNRTTQFMQLLSNAVGPFTSLDVWAPAGPNIPPLKADQVTLGYFATVAAENLQLSAEGFYKVYRDHPDYANHANLLYNPLMEGELRFGDAWAYGVELMLRKPSGKFTGWIGYTWSRAWIQTPEVNAGQAYPASWDSPHNIVVFLHFDTRKRWTFSANWIYMTGNPVTTPTGFFWYNGSQVPIYGVRNNDRLPDYHRLDLSVLCRLSKPESRFRHSVEITLYNLYGRANPFTLSFNKTRDGKGDYVVPSNISAGQELVPTMISVAGMIPSINYQFRF